MELRVSILRILNRLRSCLFDLAHGTGMAADVQQTLAM
jgi:hypothetical protein